MDKAWLDGFIYEKHLSPDGNISISMSAPLMADSFNIKSKADINLWQKFMKEDELEVNLKAKKLNSEVTMVTCDDFADLTIDRVLKTLSVAKSRLMLECVPIHIRKIECSMTPSVRKNIISASKKLKMYGKKKPIIACFDEYGNKLPDELNINDATGITLKIVDPKFYGEYYFELKGFSFPESYYDPLPF